MGALRAGRTQVVSENKASYRLCLDHSEGPPESD